MDLNCEDHLYHPALQHHCGRLFVADAVFNGEFRVDAAYRSKAENRGGDGIIPLKRMQNVWTGVRDIRLERHPA